MFKKPILTKWYAFLGLYAKRESYQKIYIQNMLQKLHIPTLLNLFRGANSDRFLFSLTFTSENQTYHPSSA